MQSEMSAVKRGHFRSASAAVLDRILYWRVDGWPTVIGMTVVALQFGAFSTGSVLVLPAIVIGIRWVHLCEHNLAHLDVFRWQLANRVYGALLALATGVPLELYRAQHVLTHHRHEDSPADWTSPRTFGWSDPDRRRYLAAYVAGFAWRSWTRGATVLRDDLRLRREWRWSIALWCAGAGVLAVSSPQRFLVFYLVPWLVSYAGVAIANWMHHVGCDPGDRINGANVNLHWTSRRVGFNIGYHSAHHAYPDAHWSTLHAIFEREFQNATPPARVRHTRALRWS